LQWLGSAGQAYDRDNFGRGTQTLLKWVDKVVNVIVDKWWREKVRFPNTEEDLKKLMHESFQARGLPGCIGALDGKHFLTVAGGQDPAAYKNYKGKRSLNVLAVALLDYRIAWMSDFWAGVTVDGRAWNEGDLLPRMRQLTWIPSGASIPLGDHRLRPYVVADAAFAGRETVVKGFPARRATAEQRTFNVLLSSNRQAIEQTWGIIANRFRRWRLPCELRGEGWQHRVAQGVRASVVLHNLCIEQQEDLKFPDEEEAKLDNDPPQEEEPDESSLDLVRYRLCEYVNRWFRLSPTGHLLRKQPQ